MQYIFNTLKISKKSRTSAISNTDSFIRDMKYENEKLKHASESLKLLGDTYKELENIRHDNAINRGRDAAVSQLYDMSEVFNEYSRETHKRIDIPKKTYAHLISILHKRNVYAENINFTKKRKKYYEITMDVKLQKNACVTSKELADIISHVFNKKFVPDDASRRVINKELNRYIFIEETPYKTVCGVSRCGKIENDVSGDNFSLCTPDNVRTVMCLCDGMGSGRRASFESEIMVELLERFLEAGFMEITAIKMINLAYATENYTGHPVTMDMAVIDKYSGNMKMIKMGAAPTFIKRATTKEIEIISSTSMPAGVFEVADIEEYTTNLNDGDMVIMISDGILDAINSNNKEEYLEGMISALNIKNPQIFAERLLLGVTNTSNAIKDDMTIIVTGIWSKSCKNLILA